MSDTPTPRTDALWDMIKGSLLWTDHPARLLSESLERELSDCLVTLREVKKHLELGACRCDMLVDEECPRCRMLKDVETTIRN